MLATSTSKTYAFSLSVATSCSNSLQRVVLAASAELTSLRSRSIAPVCRFAASTPSLKSSSSNSSTLLLSSTCFNCCSAASALAAAAARASCVLTSKADFCAASSTSPLRMAFWSAAAASCRCKPSISSWLLSTLTRKPPISDSNVAMRDRVMLSSSEIADWCAVAFCKRALAAATSACASASSLRARVTALSAVPLKSSSRRSASRNAASAASNVARARSRLCVASSSLPDNTPHLRSISDRSPSAARNLSFNSSRCCSASRRVLRNLT
mmetsp:Transcript_17305/g.31605  ORF Transcript_17305/g.31605 Transcript_17305/m.31605 type:complete len:270 (+) Transcript_17305:1295-2104(+)